MVYVQRDGALVTGVFSNFNPGVTEETPLEDEHPDVVAYRERMLPRPVADVLPLIIGGLHSRISALEALGDVEVLNILTTSGDPPVDMVSDVEDEDPGEQDLGAEMLAAEDEAAAAPADHGGVMIQPPDEIYALRDFVRGRISEAKLIRLDAATDPTRWQTLNAYESQYNNLWRLKHELHGEAIVIPPEVAQGHEEYLLAFARQSAIESHALDLERRAATAEKATLGLMAADIWSGGP